MEDRRTIHKTTDIVKTEHVRKQKQRRSGRATEQMEQTHAERMDNIIEGTNTSRKAEDNT